MTFDHTGPEAQKLVAAKRGGAPRWMWTFADLMSLLFALFVLLLTFADFDAKKFQETMDPVRTHFNKYSQASVESPSIAPHGSSILPFHKPVTVDVDPDDLRRLEDLRQMRQATVQQLRTNLASELSAGLVILQETQTGVILRFPSATAFELGGAALAPDVAPILERTARVLKAVTGRITISGHTDDLPISSARFRSNWDLSTARAVSVVHYLLENGIDPRRVSASGFAETQPLVPNDNAEQRAINRRVEVEVTIGPTTGSSERAPTEHEQRFQNY